MSSLFDFGFEIINPEAHGNLGEQVKDCAQQLGSLYTGFKEETVIVRANWFFGMGEGSTCIQMHSEVLEAMSLKGLLKIPFTVVAERPTGESLVQLVVCFISNFSSHVVAETRNLRDNVYCLVKHGNQKWLFSGGSGCFDEKKGIPDSAHRAFQDVKSIVENEALPFSNLLRQWNYIPGIVETETNEKGQLIQHYQEFNDVRAIWYQKEGLVKDFPAATGIGVSGGGVIIEVIALNSVKELLVSTLHNPEQSDAHSYSASQLVGEKAKETPRFERGKMIYSKGKGHLWVSGTAAIRGEESVPGGILEQCTITCENIDVLINKDNLINSGLEAGNYIIHPIYVRAYVKILEHGIIVQEFLEKRYPGANIHVLQANVCREELLVEVEGEFSICLTPKPPLLHSASLHGRGGY